MAKQRKSIQVFLIEFALVVSLVAVIGHSAFNIWERCVIQKELTRMKSSLNSMKNTVNTISCAYDHLHRDLSRITELSEEEIYGSTLRCMDNQGYYQENSVPIEAKSEVSVYDRHVGTPSKENTFVEAELNPYISDETTMTRYPLKSIGTLKSVEKVERYTDYNDIPDVPLESDSSQSFYTFFCPNRSVYAHSDYKDNINAYSSNFKVMRADTSEDPEYNDMRQMLEKYYNKAYIPEDPMEDVDTSVSDTEVCETESIDSDNYEEKENDIFIDRKTERSTSYNSNSKPLLTTELTTTALAPTNKQTLNRVTKFRNRKLQSNSIV